MVAMPEQLRQPYVEHLLARLAPEAKVLLVVLSYDGEQSGPPFSVLDREVVSLWGDKVHKIASEDLLQLDERYQDSERTFYEESVWRVMP